MNVLTKAYLRRGLAYEHCEKFKLAANDLTRVKQMEPMNKQAKDSLSRCLKCIKQDEGIEYVPEGDDIRINANEPVELSDPVAVFHMEETKAPTVEKQADPKPEYLPEKKEQVKNEPLLEKKEQDLNALVESLKQIKERGNLQFKKKAYKEAIKLFSEGVKLFEEQGKPIENLEVKTVITQIFTNRSLAFHSIDQQNSALSDANYVIEHLDSLNAKALFRRVHAFKKVEKYAEAVKDLETLVNKTTDGKQFAKDLSECRGLLEQQRKK